MDSSNAKSYLQNQIQYKKLGLDSENRFSVHGHIYTTRLLWSG